MKLICSRHNLLEGINIVQKAVSSKTTLPILEGILLEADEKFKLTGNDLEIGIECYVVADIQKKGSIVINSKMLGDIVRRLPDSEVLIEVRENNSVIIECENSFFELKGIVSTGFPTLPSIVKQNSFTSTQKIIRDMIRQTIFSISVDENRPILTGIFIDCKNGELTFVSIDGFRLSLRKSNLSDNESHFNVVVPGRTLNEVMKILQQNDEVLNIYTASNQILFDLGNCKILSRLLDGEYLNYKNIIPQNSETNIIVDTKDLLSGIERASLLTIDDKRFPVKFIINDNKIVMTSHTEKGNAREEIHIEMDGSKLEIGFNPKYFMDALKVIEDEKVQINFSNSLGPCTIKSLNNSNYIYLIVPVRIKND